MPNRIVREGILSSDRVNKLSWVGEVFYRRLMSVVDDFGRFDGRASIIRISAFPLKVNQVSESDIVKWSDECAAAGLIRFYEVDGKRYLELHDFDQRLRIKKSKYPAPTDDGHMSDTRQPETKVNQNPKIETEYEVEENARAQSFDFSIPPSLAMCEGLFEKSGKPKELGAKFFHHYNSVGWTIKGSPITNWGSLAEKWIIDEKNFNNGKQFTGKTGSGVSDQKRSVADVKNLAREVLRQSGGN